MAKTAHHRGERHRTLQQWATEHRRSTWREVKGIDRRRSRLCRGNEAGTRISSKN